MVSNSILLNNSLTRDVSVYLMRDKFKIYEKTEDVVIFYQNAYQEKQIGVQ